MERKLNLEGQVLSELTEVAKEQGYEEDSPIEKVERMLGDLAKGRLILTKSDRYHQITKILYFLMISRIPRDPVYLSMDEFMDDILKGKLYIETKKGE